MFTRFLSLFSKPKKKELDEFDEKYRFMLKYNLTSEKSYNEVKEFYFQNINSTNQ